MKTILGLALLMSSCVVSAGQLSLSFGPTIDGSIGERKVFAVGYELQFGGPSVMLKGGLWNEGGSFTGFVAANVGVHVVTEGGLSVRVGVGPAAISRTNDRLSSIGEFDLDARVGVEMKNFAAGGNFTHLSNAGIVGPNLGMDWLGLYIAIPL